MMSDDGQEEWQRGPGDPKQEMGGGGGGGGVKLKGDKNRKGRSKNIQEYQERGVGGILKLKRD